MSADNLADELADSTVAKSAYSWVDGMGKMMVVGKVDWKAATMEQQLEIPMVVVTVECLAALMVASTVVLTELRSAALMGGN